MVLKYIIRGFEEVKKSSGEDSVFTELVEYFEHIEDFKHCTDEVRAAGLLEIYKLTLDHVPGHLLKSKEVKLLIILSITSIRCLSNMYFHFIIQVWNALIPSMNLDLLLTNLQRIHNLELLKPNSPTVFKIVDRITSEENISRDKVHPAKVLVTIRDYENSGK